MANDLILPETMKAISLRYRHAATVDELKWTQEKQFFITAVGKSRDLQVATQDSLVTAALQAAGMGLSFNPIRQHVYLIPRRARKRYDNETPADYEKKVPIVASAQPSYMGLSHIAVAARVAEFLRAEVVFKKDKFEYRGPIEKPKHIPTLKAEERNEAAAIGVYAICKLVSGDYLCEYLDRDTVMKIKAKSENKKSMMWDPNDMWTEGWKKSAIRRLYKTIPKPDQRMEAAVQAMDTHEGVAVGATDITSESVQVINDAQHTELHAMLTDRGIEGERATAWLDKLAFGIADVGTIADLPAGFFEEAKEKLKEGLKNYKPKAKDVGTIADLPAGFFEEAKEKLKEGLKNYKPKAKNAD
jgi:recombinational DNA repair protein RecT